MNYGSFQWFQHKLEREIIIEGVIRGKLGQNGLVQVRSGKLVKTKFGEIVGGVINTDLVMAMDYYGLIKKSRGLLSYIEDLQKEMGSKQIKSVRCTVVFFASLRMEDIYDLQASLLNGFPHFKKRMLELRGFKNGE